MFKNCRGIFLRLISIEAKVLTCINPVRFNKLNIFILCTDLLIKLTSRWYVQCSCLQLPPPLELVESAQSRTCKKRFQTYTIIFGYLKREWSSLQVCLIVFFHWFSSLFLDIHFNKAPLFSRWYTGRSYKALAEDSMHWYH